MTATTLPADTTKAAPSSFTLTIEVVEGRISPAPLIVSPSPVPNLEVIETLERLAAHRRLVLKQQAIDAGIYYAPTQPPTPSE